MRIVQPAVLPSDKERASKLLKNHALNDADFQAIKIAMRELGYIPNPQIIYEMAIQVYREVNNIGIFDIDELCDEDRLAREESDRRERDSHRQAMMKMRAAMAGYTAEENPYQKESESQ